MIIIKNVLANSDEILKKIFGKILRNCLTNFDQNLAAYEIILNAFEENLRHILIKIRKNFKKTSDNF